MRSSDRLVGSRSRRSAEQFTEARLVRITRGGAAIEVNPVGMLDPQIVVNLFLELRVGVDLVSHGHWFGETFKCDVWRLVELILSVSVFSFETTGFHKQPSI
jgi:hypothetical protein